MLGVKIPVKRRKAGYEEKRRTERRRSCMARMLARAWRHGHLNGAAYLGNRYLPISAIPRRQRKESNALQCEAALSRQKRGGGGGDVKKETERKKEEERGRMRKEGGSKAFQGIRHCGW